MGAQSIGTFKRFWVLIRIILVIKGTALKVSKYGVLSGPYFLVFELDTGKYGPEKTPYLDTFQAVRYTKSCLIT